MVHINSNKHNTNDIQCDALQGIEMLAIIAFLFFIEIGFIRVTNRKQYLVDVRDPWDYKIGKEGIIVIVVKNGEI